MFLCRRARFYGSVADKFCYGFPGIAEVRWTLSEKPCGSCPRVYVNDSYNLCRINETLDDNFVNYIECNMSSNSGQISQKQRVPVYVSKSSMESVFGFPWTSNSRKTMGRLDVPDCIVVPCRVMITIRSSTDLSRALSTEATQKPDIWSKTGPATETTTSPLGGNDIPEPEKKQNKKIKLKKIFKEYGGVGVAFHIGISLISLGVFYLVLSSGIDMAAVLFKMGFSDEVVQSKMAAGTSTFVLAYAVHKLFAPLRISITLVSVPLIVRYLRKIGLFKPPSRL